jgi:hypothetical protein
MESLQCTDAQKVNYASLKLMGEASHWWLARKELIAAELGQGVPITWDRFKKEFDDHSSHRLSDFNVPEIFKNLLRAPCLWSNMPLDSMSFLGMLPPL